jgi:hypothetical protein
LTFSNIGATTDGPLACGGVMGSDVWYQVTAPCNGNADVATFPGSDPNFDTVLAAYDGCDCANLGAALVCNDDIGGSLQSQIFFAVVEGNCYTIQVGGYRCRIWVCRC